MKLIYLKEVPNLPKMQIDVLWTQKKNERTTNFALLITIITSSVVFLYISSKSLVFLHNKPCCNFAREEGGRNLTQLSLFHPLS